MRILHYIPSIDADSGGVGAYMQLLAEELGTLCDLHILTHPSGQMLEMKNCHVHLTELINNPLSLKARRQFIETLEGINPDVFHTNCCWLPQSARMAVWAKSRGYRVAYSPHGMLEPWIMKRHYWTRKLPAILLYQLRGIRCADVVCATAESERKNLRSLGWNDSVCVVPNCVQIRDIRLKSSWKRTKNILFLSRIHVKKGIENLLRATAALKDRLNGYTITIAGMGEETYIQQLKEKAKSYGIGHIVRFAGPVFGADKWTLYRNADFFVLPTFSENFGIVVAEALASGTPVITTEGAPWQELNSCGCGRWIGIGAEPLAEAIGAFLDLSESELETMGRNGRKLIEERYAAPMIARKFMSLYRSLAAIT